MSRRADVARMTQLGMFVVQMTQLDTFVVQMTQLDTFVVQMIQLDTFVVQMIQLGMCPALMTCSTPLAHVPALVARMTWLSNRRGPSA